MEVSLVNVMAHEKIMEQALEPFKDKYDYCLIDCMPSLGIITVASLVAADRVLIPVQAQHFALKGLVSLFKSVNQVERKIHIKVCQRDNFIDIFYQDNGPGLSTKYKRILI